MLQEQSVTAAHAERRRFLRAVGANAGLGYLLLRGTSYLDMPLIFAVLVALSLVGIAFSYAVQYAERWMMPWQYK